MKEEKLQKGINEIKNIRMTELEKSQILHSIYNSNKEVSRPIASPWSMYAFVSIIKKSQLVYYILVPLIIILSGGGVAYASLESLPDSVLYPIKVKVLEPIGGSLKTTLSKKAKYESNLAEKRLVEAEVLASKGKLNVEIEKKLNNLLSDHTVALNNAINMANQTSSTEEIDNISTDFRAEMNAHARILDIITKHGEYKDGESINTTDPTTSDTSVINPIEDSHISSNARESAIKIKTALKNNDLKNKNDYLNKKEEVKNLIDNVDKINEVRNIKNQIKNDTNKTIEEAKKYLQESEIKDKEGDSREAYSTLLDSESKVKEANIIIKNRIDSEHKYRNRGED